MWFRLVRAEIASNRRFSWFFIISLAIGLSGFITLDAFKRSFSALLTDASRNLLTADISIDSRRPITDDEVRTATERLQPEKTTTTKSLFSMAARGEISSLVEIKAIEDSYPFYGWLKLEKQGKITGDSPKSIVGAPKVWVGTDTLLKLNAKPGDTVQLGQQTFVIDDVVTDTTSATFSGASLAPRIYIGLDQLAATQLVQPGSLVRHEVLFKLPANVDAESAKADLNTILKDPALDIDSHKDAADASGRVLAYLSDYLGLVALVAFFLAAIGAAYLFRSYLLAKQKDMAVLVSLGLTPRRTMMVYLGQILFLGVVASVLAMLVSLTLLPLSRLLVAKLTPLAFSPTFPVETAFVALLCGALGSVLICLPLLQRIRLVKPAALFQEYQRPELQRPAHTGLWYFPALLCFFVLCIWQANSVRIGSLFLGILLVAAVVLGLLGWAGIKILSLLPPKRPLSFKMASRYLTRSPLPAITSFLAMSLGALLINIIPQMERSIEAELATPPQGELPSFFMFDIQEEQKDQLEDFLTNEGIDWQLISPMIRARLVALNDKPFEKSTEETMTREGQEEQRFRNRGVNLSYRQDLSAAEEIVSGRPFSGAYDGDGTEPAEISIERRYAQRLGIEVGDRLVFEVQSVPISGVVVNLRKVKWTSFQPNFFIQFQEGVLEEAPKTFVAALPDLPEERKHALQTDLVRTFPNVSIIDVGQLIGKILEMTRQLGFILHVMAWFSLIAGVTVLFFMAHHQASERLWDLNLLKILGMKNRTITATSLWEFGLLGAAAGLLGAFAGMLVSWFVATWIFDSAWAADFSVPLTTTLLVTGIAVVTTVLAQRRLFKMKPALYLQTK